MTDAKRRFAGAQSAGSAVEDGETAAAGASSSGSTYDRVVDLLNKASLMVHETEKLTNLKMVEELIVNKEPSLLDNFLDEMLAFQTDKSVEVKKYVIHFMEQACKADPELLVRLSSILSMMMAEEHVAVVKKLVLCMAQIYKAALMWLAKSRSVSDAMKQTWQTIVKVKSMITEMIDSENDGVRTCAIKFLESVVIILSYKVSGSEISKPSACEPCLDLIPESHSLLKARKLEEEGKQAFEVLMSYQSSQHISSVNLMTCLGSMTNIVRHRPIFMTRVIQAFESLHANLPPTLSKSQVSSVRKNLKMQMLSLLRLPSSIDFQSNITTLLTDLGATQSEVARCLPKLEETKKRKGEDMNASGKKPKTEILIIPNRDEDDDDIIPWQTSSLSSSSSALPRSSASAGKSSMAETGETQKQQTAIDITADDLVPRMTPQNVTDLVLLSMVMLPDTMPAQFQATYTPIAAAGTQIQIKHMSRLLATQLTSAGMGRGITEVKKNVQNQPPVEKDVELVDEDDGFSSKQVIETVVGGSTGGSSSSFTTPSVSAVPAPVQITRKGIIQFKLSSVTKPVPDSQRDSLALAAFRRILSADKAAQAGCVSEARSKVLVSLVSMYGGQLRDELLDYIFLDLRNRADLALAWIHQEYANYQGYNLTATVPEKPLITNYDSCLTHLLSTLLAKPDQKEGLFSRLIMEAPNITPNAIEILKQYCQDDTRIYLGMTTLKELIVKRPSMKMEFLDILLNFTSHEKLEVRNNAIRVVKKLHERNDLRDTIEKYAMYYLKFLLQPSPPSDIISSKTKLEPDTWSEDAIKLCLYLYLSLLPVNHKLIHELANVYTATSGDIKRIILRVLETPVKGMGMDSPELLLLVENCPRGAETLVTRVIHILTDKAAPSPELVDRVRDLYQKRVSDVRFLIPVLNGLTKKEVIAALPKLIKLNPIVVKEVFNRLLGVHGQENFVSPLTPAELLIALHGLDMTKVDMKTIIKACNLCFAEKSIYTQEVLAVVMQQLMELMPIPTLLMRTVIQSLSMYPKLIGFVMNIMQRLITKQVWKNRKIWEGFIKCCQRTKPQSFQVLLQLPAVQLKDVFSLSPELREPLLTHVQAFTPHQRAHIPKAIMSILEKDPHDEQKVVEKAKRAEDERLAQQEKIYQQKLEDERRKHQDLMKQKLELENSPLDHNTDLGDVKP